MKKKIATIALTLLACLLSCVAFIACGGGNGGGKCAHKSTSEIIILDATCTETGTKRVTCKGCGDNWEAVIPAKGHSMKDASASNVIASCTSAGLTITICERCDAVVTSSIPALGHEWDDGVDNLSDACDVAGKTTYTCKHKGCGATRVEVTEASGHDYKIVESKTVDATCTANGRETYKCSHCQDEYTVITAALGHDWDNAVPTCTLGQTCMRDGCSAHGMPALGHNYKLVQDQERAAHNCDEETVLVYACTNGDCDDSYQVTVPAKGHNYAAAIWVESEIEPTAQGCVKHYTSVCVDCDTTLTRETEPVEHAYSVKITTPATCSQNGVKKYTCLNCGYEKEEPYSDNDAHKWVISENASGAATVTYTCEYDHAHTKTVVKGGTQATVTSDKLGEVGEVELDKASVALDDGTKNDLTGDVAIKAEAVDQAVLDTIKNALGNKADAIDGEVLDFTMTAGGSSVTSFGGNVTVRIPYELQPNDDVNELVIIYIDSDNELQEVNAVYSDGYAVFTTSHFSYYTVTRMTAAERCAVFGHTEASLTKQATCTTDGYDIKVCKRCGITISKVETPAYGHDWHDTVEAEPDCEHGGTTSHRCSTCDAGYSITVPALGHDWAIERTPATCTQEGTNKYTCKTCAAEHTQSLPALGHDYEYTVVAPTCISAGYRENTCTVCGDTYKSDYTPSADHVWNVAEPTCTEDKVCTACGSFGAAALGHDYNDNHVCKNCNAGCEHYYISGRTVVATCTSGGYKVSVCALCNDEKHTDVVPALGHDYGTDGKCKNCGNKKPVDGNFWANVIKSFTQSKYTFTVSDLDITNYVTLYAEGKDPETYVNNKVTQLDVITLSFGYSADGSIYGYGKGKVKTVSNYRSTGESSEIVADATIAIDNGYFYMLAQSPDQPDVYACGSIEGILQEMLGNGELASGIIKGAFKDVMPIFNKIFAANISTINTYAEAALGKLLSVNATGSEYVLDFDPQVLYTLNDDLGKKTAAQFLDGMFGEGFTAKLGAKVKSLLNKTVSAAIADIAAKGTSEKELFDAANDIMYLVTGKKADVNEMLENYELVVGLGLKDTKLNAVIAALADMTVEQLMGTVDEVIGMLDENSVYELIEMLMPKHGPEYDKPMDGDDKYKNDIDAHDDESALPSQNEIYEYVKQILDMYVPMLKKSLGIKLFTDSKGNVKSATVALNKVNISTGGYSYEGGERGESNATISGVLVITPNSADTKPVKSLVDTVKSAMPKIAQNTVVNCPEGSSYDITVDANGNIAKISMTRVETERRLSNKIEYKGKVCDVYSVRTETVTAEYDFSVAKIITYEKNYCADWGAYTYAGGKLISYDNSYANKTEYVDTETGDVVFSSENNSGSYDSYRRSASMTLYYNAKTKVLSDIYPHDFVYSEAQSKVPVACTDIGYRRYVCSNCGEYYDENYSLGHGHDKGITNDVKLADGAKSCTQGVIAKTICNDCGKTVSERRYNNHHTYRHTIVDFSECGSVCGGYAYVYRCACGEVSEGVQTSSSCKMSSESTYGDNDVYYSLRTCAVEGCGFRYGYKIEHEQVANSCDVIEKFTYYFGITVRPEQDERAIDAFARGSFDFEQEHKYEYSRKIEKRHTITVNDQEIAERVVMNGDGTYTVTTGYRHYETCSVCGLRTGSEAVYAHTYNSNDEAVLHTVTRTEIREDSKDVYYTEYGYFTSKRGNKVELVTLSEVKRYEDGKLVEHYKNEYEYDADCLCYAEYVHTNMLSDYSRRETSTNHIAYVADVDSCTQNGRMRCEECGAVDNEKQYGYEGRHYWIANANGEYTCARCGLESHYGAEGRISFEDLTNHDRYGKDGYYTVGYASRYYYNWDWRYNSGMVHYFFDVELSFVVKNADGEWETVAYNSDVYEIEVDDDGVSLIYIDIKDVEAYCKAMGYDEYMLCVSFVPTMEHDECVYTITLDRA